MVYGIRCMCKSLTTLNSYFFVQLKCFNLAKVPLAWPMGRAAGWDCFYFLQENFKKLLFWIIFYIGLYYIIKSYTRDSLLNSFYFYFPHSSHIFFLIISSTNYYLFHSIYTKFSLCFLHFSCSSHLIYYPIYFLN